MIEWRDGGAGSRFPQPYLQLLLGFDGNPICRARSGKRGLAYDDRRGAMSETASPVVDGIALQKDNGI